MRAAERRRRTRLGAAGGTAVLLATTALWGVPAAADDTDDTSGESTHTDYARMILVLDSSGSMKEDAGGGGTKIEAARTALTDVVNTLPATADVGMRVFGAKVFSRSEPGACTDSQLVVEPGTDNRDELLAAIGDYTPYGETPIAHALREAASDIGSEGTRSIVLVSDGEATCDPDPCEVAGELRDKGIDLQINVVGIDVSGKARAQLRCIAASGGGKYYDADSAEEISESLALVSERALRPFELDGEPVSGGADVTSAVDVEPGRYVDRVGDGDDGERWYRVERTMERSTVVISTYELVAGSRARLSLVVEAEDGTRCTGGHSPIFHKFSTSDQVVVSGVDEETAESCRGGALRFRVRSYSSEGVRDYGFGIVEEPEVVNAADLPVAFDDEEMESAGLQLDRPVVSGPEVEVTPGTTFADAAELESGKAYSVTAVEDEVHSFKVPLTWGQRLKVRLTRPGGVHILDSVDDGIQVLSPTRASLFEGLPRTTGLGGTAEGTRPVRWQTRHASAGTFLAGDYYVLVGLGSEDDDSVEHSYRLEVEVVGDEEGVPEYADGQQVLGLDDVPDSQGGAGGDSEEAAGDGADGSADSGEASDEEGGLSVVQVAGAAGLGVVALACVVVAVRLLRRD